MGDDVVLVSGYELNKEWKTGKEWKTPGFPPPRQLQHAREGDIGLWISDHAAEAYLLVFRNKVFARLC